jgi:hypothetical protein
VSAPLSSDSMTGLIKRVVVDGQTVADVARRFLATYGLL